METVLLRGGCYVRSRDDGTSGVGESTFFGWPTAVAEIVRSYRNATSRAKTRSTWSITGSRCTALSASEAWR